MALEACRSLEGEPNPLREALRSSLQELEYGDFRIFCHRAAIPEVETLFEESKGPVPPTTYLNSVRDYRESRPFSHLIKVGPLRSRGWGATPSAVLTAPRFTTLRHFVWSGCEDEPGFARDPFHSWSKRGTEDEPVSPSSSRDEIHWTPKLRTIGIDETTDDDRTHALDEFGSFRELMSSKTSRKAVLISTDEEHGVLYPLHSRILSFDPDNTSTQAIERRLASESLMAGMYLVRPLLHDVDLGTQHASHGFYSRDWKEKLTQQCQADIDSLAARLENAGVKLRHLQSAVTKWCRAPTTVIHAPQRRSHFEALVRELGLDSNPVTHNQSGRSWSQEAWAEVRRSRGEAIQAGVQEHEILEEELLVLLASCLDEVRDAASDSASFTISMPGGKELQGFVLFDRICGVEDGFLVPETELRIVRDIQEVELWRV